MTPVIVRVRFCGAVSAMTPVGLVSVMTMLGRIVLSESPIDWSRSGRLWSTKPKTANPSASAGKIEKKAK